MADPKHNAMLILALGKGKHAEAESKPSPLAALLGAHGDEPDADDAPDAMHAIEACLKRLWSAASKGDWSEAASASNDLHELQCDACESHQDESIYHHGEMPPSDEDSKS